MTKDKKIKLAISILLMVLCITQIQQTFAKYLDQKTGDSNFNIASWSIKVNNQDITSAATISSLINPVYVANANVANGVIAPGSEGYFDLNIDATDTDVSFNYTISVATSASSDVSDLIITGYQIDSGSMVNTSESASITNAIRYSDATRTKNIRVYFRWRDGTGEDMDNADDTDASINNGNASLTVSIRFIQITS